MNEFITYFRFPLMVLTDIIKSTIMFTDIVGYSAMTNKDQEHALELLSTHDSIIEPIISQNDGKIIKKIGDSIFAEFLNPQDSIHTAQKIQSNLKKRNSVCSKQDHIQIRIGLHTGEVVRKDDDLFGHDVNLCSRIESISPRGGIAASAELIEFIKDGFEFPIREMGYIKLKNIVNPHQIYKIYLDQNDYQTESDKQLQQNLSDHGIEILDMDTYTTRKTFSAAVLYVKNLGRDEDESIAYGLTENLINDFAYINNFRTPGFNETLHYKNTELGRDDIGRKLQVNNILHGTFLKEKETLKLSFELLDINQGQILWSETWTDQLSNNNNIRSHILTSVLSQFGMEIPQQLQDSLLDKMTNNQDALEAYYEGKYCSDFLTSKEDLANGNSLLKKALVLDSNFVEAHYLYGMSCQRLGNNDAAETALLEGQDMAESKNNLQGLAFIYKGFSTLYSAWGKWDKARFNIEKALKIQVDLNNNTVEAMLRLDYANLLNHLEETDLSIEQNKQASRLLINLEDDRLLGISYAVMANSYLVINQFTQSITSGNKAIGIFRKLGMTNYEARLLVIVGDGYCRTGDLENLKIVVESALPIVQEFDDIFLEGKLNYFNAHYYLNQNDFSSTISYIDKSIELYNLAEQTRFETQTLIDKLCVLMENESDNIDPIITKIERLIKKLKGTYGSYLFTAIKLYINSNKDNENSDDPNDLLKAIEKPRSIIPVTYPLIYWYLARTYHAIGQSDKANKCHEKAKNIITTLAEGVTDIKNIENYYNLYFHKRIGEKLS